MKEIIEGDVGIIEGVTEDSILIRTAYGLGSLFCIEANIPPIADNYIGQSCEVIVDEGELCLLFEDEWIIAVQG
jgi:hypothetical protein